jgi:pimeloyl-ACP methyl ester carboxylesterase
VGPPRPCWPCYDFRRLGSDFQLKSLRSFDGTEIAYQLGGAGEGIPIVLSNGLGGDYRAWKYIFDHFAARHPMVTWDYRGLYRSGRPALPHTLGPASQARDLEAILDELGWRKVLLVGWSMGVQVNFEAWRRFPSRIAALAVINGVAGRPFDTALGSRFLKHVIPPLLRQMRRRARIVRRLTGVATAWSGLLPTMQRIGFVGATIDFALFAEFARTFSTLDFDLYGATLEALGQHDARAVVPTVTVPMSIITGDRDLMTPLSTARFLRDAVPHARMVVLPGGTHYTPVEFPEEVCAELERLSSLVPMEKRA